LCTCIPARKYVAVIWHHDMRQYTQTASPSSRTTGWHIRSKLEIGISCEPPQICSGCPTVQQARVSAAPEAQESVVPEGWPHWKQVGNTPHPQADWPPPPPLSLLFPSSSSFSSKNGHDNNNNGSKKSKKNKCNSGRSKSMSDNNISVPTPPHQQMQNRQDRCRPQIPPPP